MRAQRPLFVGYLALMVGLLGAISGATAQNAGAAAGASDDVVLGNPSARVVIVGINGASEEQKYCRRQGSDFIVSLANIGRAASTPVNFHILLYKNGKLFVGRSGVVQPIPPKARRIIRTRMTRGLGRVFSFVIAGAVSPTFITFGECKSSVVQ